MKQFIIILGFLFLIFDLSGQVTIKGIVYIEDGEEAIGANVVVKGNETIGTVTEFDGTFELEVESLPVYIEISYTSEPVLILVENAEQIIVVNLTEEIIWCEFPIVYDTRLLHSANYNELYSNDLKIDNSVSVTSSMNTAPGIHIHSGALNTNRITIRGIGNRSQFTTAKIRAYLDGIPLTSGVGETTLEDIDMDMLSSITIVKGPNVSNYGSGLGGSIIMRTDNDKNDFISSKFELGSYGLIRSSNAINIATDKSRTRANYSFTNSDGYRENNEYKRHNFSLLNQFDYEEDRQFNFLLNYTDLHAFIPSSLNEDDYLNDPTSAAFTWNKVKGFEDYSKIQLGVSHNYGWKKWVNNSSIFGTFFNSYESRPFNILRENSRTLGARTKFNFNFETFGNVSFLKFGAEYFNEKYDWKTHETLDGILGQHLSDNIENRQYYNIFAEADWELYRNLTIETGINLNSTRYEIEDNFYLDSIDISGKYQFDLILSPRVGINYLWDERDISFFANVSHGFNSPSLEETLTPDGSKNPDIQPEKGWNYEIGSRGKIIRNNLFYSASLYYMDVKDLLVAKRISLDQFQGINAGRTSHLGLEIDLEYDYRFNSHNTITPFFNYHFAHYTFKDFVDGDNDYSGNELTGAIPHKINAGIKMNFKHGIYSNLIYQYVDKMPMRDDNSIYSDSYQTMNLKLGYNKTFNEKWAFDIYTGIRNIWNEKYASQILINAGSFGGNAPRYYYPGLPRNYYGGVSLKYLW